MKVSVIIPYNIDRGWLGKAIASLQNQSFKGEIEIVLSKSVHGVSYNINRGIEKSTGQLIRYLCEDDMLTPNSIQDTVDFFINNPDVDFVHGNAQHIGPDGIIHGMVKPRITALNLSDLMARNHIHGGTQTYRRSVFEKHGMYDEKLWTGEEFEFHLRILKAGAKIGYIDKTLYLYRRHSRQKSTGSQSPLKHVERVKAITEIRRKHR